MKNIVCLLTLAICLLSCTNELFTSDLILEEEVDVKSYTPNPEICRILENQAIYIRSINNTDEAIYFPYESCLAFCMDGEYLRNPTIEDILDVIYYRDITGDGEWKIFADRHYDRLNSFQYDENQEFPSQYFSYSKLELYHLYEFKIGTTWDVYKDCLYMSGSYLFQFLPERNVDHWNVREMRLEYGFNIGHWCPPGNVYDVVISAFDEIGSLGRILSFSSSGGTNSYITFLAAGAGYVVISVYEHQTFTMVSSDRVDFANTDSRVGIGASVYCN